MKRLRWLVFPCVLLLAATLVQGAVQEKKKSGLKGTWTKDKDGKTVKLTFEKGKFEISFDGKEFSGTYKADPKKKPKELDMTIEKGSDNKFDGKTALCIYEVDGDTLKWCACKPGITERPKEFPDKEGEGETLYIVFKRAK